MNRLPLLALLVTGCLPIRHTLAPASAKPPTSTPAAAPATAPPAPVPQPAEKFLTTAPETARQTVREGQWPTTPCPLFVRSVGGTEGGPTLLLISGGPGLSHDYMMPLERLATPSLRVVDYDARGVGHSKVDAKTPLGYAESLADLEALRVQLGVEQLHLLGHSFGGGLAMAYAVAHPEHVASLLLVGPVMPAPNARAAIGKSINARFAELTRQGLLPDPLPSVPADAWHSVLPAYFSNPRWTLPEVLRTTSPEPRVFREVSTKGLDLRPQLANLKVPVLLLFGAEDLLGKEAAEATREAFVREQPKLIYLENCGHFPWFECPTSFYAEVTAFLQEVVVK